MKKYRGVNHDKSRPSPRKFQARLTVDGETRNVGWFLTAEEAALAYDRAAASTWGSMAVLNFPNLVRVD